MADFGKVDFSTSLTPTAAFPLDGRVVFETLADAQDIAKTAEEIGSTNTRFWYGMKLFVIETNSWYKIETDGSLIIEGYGAGGGGGGGDSYSYVITLTNLLQDRAFSIAKGGEAVLKFKYASVTSEGDNDGPGVGSITVNGTRVATISLAQGENEFDVSSYLSGETNTIKIEAQNSEDRTRTLTYTITIVSLELTSSTPQFVYTNVEKEGEDYDYGFSYSVSGKGVKTVHFLLDGKEIDTVSVADTIGHTYKVPRQKHGAYIFEAYAELSSNGVSIRSQTKTYCLMWFEKDVFTPVIGALVDKDNVLQGEIITVQYFAYDPMATESAEVSLQVIAEDGFIYSTKTLLVDQTVQKWAVTDYPIGNIDLAISCGATKKTFAITVADNPNKVEPITDSLVFEFNPVGRSNEEKDPAQWSCEVGTGANKETIEATFTNIGFRGSDGWLLDDDGATVLRLLPDSETLIPYKFFSTNRISSGATIEVELATHNVRKYDSIVINCMVNKRGFLIASQYAQMNSEGMSISVQFKEDSRVRISFVIDPVDSKTNRQLVYVYVNGVMSGVSQYYNTDNFSQGASAVGLTIGAMDSGIDLYRIQMYNRGLSRYEVLTNYIATRSTLAERTELNAKNDVLNSNNVITVDKVAALMSLPYLVISSDSLPQAKGDAEAKVCSLTYVDPNTPTQSFTAEGVSLKVQGTSSAGYKKKNFKIGLKNGLTYTSTGETATKFALRGEKKSIPTKTFCLKADVASSEGANNVELVRLYNDICPFRTAAQEDDPRIRTGIDGFPIVVFWNNTAANQTVFWGKYNFNNDKGTEEVYGLTEGCESWEVKNNTGNRVIFKVSDYDEKVYDNDKKEEVYAWTQDFEARYPEDNENTDALQALTDWLVSTDRAAATNNVLEAPVTYGSGEKAVTYANDTADYRLAKFKNEFEDHFWKDAMIFYYLFTEIFLMVDSRAKNFFPTYIDGTEDGITKKKWMPFPYDFDTACGINNEGELVFEYDLEDTDTTGSGASIAKVFNGQDSVLWCNVRDSFFSDIQLMYNTLRANDKLSYEKVAKAFTDHQEVWSKAIFNEDSYEKYLEPFFNDSTSMYLPMLQGDKASQRDWWLFNGFKYRDSKYSCGDAQSKFIQFRTYNVAKNSEIQVTPYSHIHPRMKVGNATDMSDRVKAGETVILRCLTDNANDTETYIYSADRIANIEGIADWNIGTADFAAATKLQKLIIGKDEIVDITQEDGSTVQGQWTNANCHEITVGNNELLSEFNIQYCIGLTSTIDMTGCLSLQKVYAKGSTVPGFLLPVGTRIEHLELPDTITNFTIRDQVRFKTLDMPSYANITTLRVENTPNIPIQDILLGAERIDKIRLTGLDWHVAATDNKTEEQVLQTCIDKILKADGMDASGNDLLGQPHLEGNIYVSSISDELLTTIFDNFPNVVVHIGGSPKYLLRYITEVADENGNTNLWSTIVNGGDPAPDPVANGTITTPTRPNGENGEVYAYTKFLSSQGEELPAAVHKNYIFVAQFSIQWKVEFYNGETLLEEATQMVFDGEYAENPLDNGLPTPTKEADAQYYYTFKTWAPELISTPITKYTKFEATWTNTLRNYTVKWYNNDGALLLTKDRVDYGTNFDDLCEEAGMSNATRATLEGDEGEYADPMNYTFAGWAPAPDFISGDLECHAQYRFYYEEAPIEDSWEEIIAAADGGYANLRYSIGNYKELDLGELGKVDMEIVGFYADELSSNPGSKAPISFISKQSLGYQKRFNVPLEVEDGTFRRDYPATDTDPEYCWFAWNLSLHNTKSISNWLISSASDGLLTIKYEVKSEGLGSDYLLLAWGDENTDLSWDIVRKDSFSAENKILIGGNYLPEDPPKTGSITFNLQKDNKIKIAAIYKKDGSFNASGERAKIIFSPEDAIKSDFSIEVLEEKEIKAKYVSNTGNIGGWPASAMRKYCQGTLKKALPLIIEESIKTVTKKQKIWTTVPEEETWSSDDSIWVPSRIEVGVEEGTSSEPAIYSKKFPYGNESRRVKYNIKTNQNESWWLRTAGTVSNNAYYCIQREGNGNNTISLSNSESEMPYLVFGFCL